MGEGSYGALSHQIIHENIIIWINETVDDYNIFNTSMHTVWVNLTKPVKNMFRSYTSR